MASILKSTPRKPVKFPPANYKTVHPVAAGEDWWSLAATYSRANAWDIIEFNFRTRDPREVNWYLEYYVGCTQPASDKKNYSFSDTDTPGKIYIPHDSWTPSDDVVLRYQVTTALSSPVIKWLSMNNGGRVVAGSTLVAIANRVIDKDIDVVFDGSLSSNEAAYDHGTDSFHLGFERATTRTRRALIIHEAVHAALDLKSYGGMSVAESESMAYVAQCFYVRAHTADPTTHRLTDSVAAKDRVFELAWDMAGTISEGGRPSSLEWLALDHAVRRHPTYSSTAGNLTGFDGI